MPQNAEPSESLLITFAANGIEGPLTSTAVDTRVAPGFKGESAALVVLDVTALTGSALAIDAKLVATVGGVQFDVPSGGFTQITASGATQEVLSVPVLPANVKVVHQIAGTTPALTGTIRVLRF